MPDEAEGVWRGHDVATLATLDGWARHRDLVRAYYDERRIACAQLMPSVSHNALARLQHALGFERCTLFTENIDGLLQKASAPDVIEMHGSLHRLRCAADRDHPQIGVFGAQNPDRRCSTCGAELRPDVVWPDEPPYGIDRMRDAVSTCNVFVLVGVAEDALANELLQLARAAGARCIEVTPDPTTRLVDEVISDPSERALHRVIGRWLDEEPTEYP